HEPRSRILANLRAPDLGVLECLGNLLLVLPYQPEVLLPSGELRLGLDNLIIPWLVSASLIRDFLIPVESNRLEHCLRKIAFRLDIHRALDGSIEQDALGDVFRDPGKSAVGDVNRLPGGNLPAFTQVPAESIEFRNCRCLVAQPALSGSLSFAALSRTGVLASSGSASSGTPLRAQRTRDRLGCRMLGSGGRIGARRGDRRGVRAVRLG